MVLDEQNPIYSPFFGVMGAASAIIFSGELSASEKKENGRTLQDFFETFEKSARDVLAAIGA